MASRLTQVEKELQQKKFEMHKKDAEIASLEWKVRKLKTALKLKDPEEYVFELETKCDVFIKNIHDLELIISRHGLGDMIKSNEDASMVDAGAHKQHDEFPFDIQRVKTVLMELSAIAGDGTSHIVKDNSSHTTRLKSVHGVKLEIYANGIRLDNVFRSFTDATAVQFMKDIQDGYFPTEIKSEHPEGVPFDVNDHHEEWFVHRETVAFAGNGVKVGESEPNVPEFSLVSETHVHDLSASPTPSHETPSQEGENVVKAAQTEIKQHPSISQAKFGVGSSSPATERFLDKIPKHIIKNGDVVNMRDEIRDLLGGPQNKHAESKKIEVDLRKPDNETSQHAHLKIVVADSMQLLVHADAAMLLSELKQHIRMYVETQFESNEWDVSIPIGTRRKLNNDSTLLDCGLVPNARLFIKGTWKRK